MLSKRIYKMDAGAPSKRYAVSSAGMWVLGDPALGKEKHTTQNQVYVGDEGEAIRLIRLGYSIRVESKTRPSLVRSNIYVDGIKVS